MPKRIRLTALQKEVLSFFGSAALGSNFYWTGGTLLAYQYLQHRLSTDIDLFSEKLLTDQEYLLLVNDLKKQLKIQSIQYTLQMNRRLYTLARQNEILKLELVYFPFSPLEKRAKLEAYKLSVDSLTDLMANKTLSAYQRQEPKDAYDLFVYLQSQQAFGLDSLVKKVERKFGVGIELSLLLGKLNQLSDKLDVIKPLLLKKQDHLARRVKKFFQEIFNKYAARRLQ